MRQTLTDDFWGLHKNKNCAFPLMENFIVRAILVCLYFTFFLFTCITKSNQILFTIFFVCSKLITLLDYNFSTKEILDKDF